MTHVLALDTGVQTVQVAGRADWHPPGGMHPGGQSFAMSGLFGWFHSDQRVAGGDVAVLICGALSREALDSLHSLRVMADAFAQAGYPTMRFDYLGTGDSSEIGETPDQSDEYWAVWQQNIHDAADRLRLRTGATRLILCGLRIGATLAALVAECRDDVAGLILLAPVLRGRSYLRQLQIEGGLAQGKGAAKGGGFEFHELSFGPQTVDSIGEVDLRRVKLQLGVKVAIFSQNSTRPLTECVTAWTGQGVGVDSYAFDGLEPLLCPDTQGYKEPAATVAIINWINQAIPSRPHLAYRGADIGEESLRLPGCIETPLRFGPEQKLFGILSRPDGCPSETAVIIVNTGRNPRTGVGRFGVEFARRLAAAGITALRFDFAGLGDSIGPACEEDMRSDVFEIERAADISAAIDAVEQFGCRRFMVHGICSGAYHAIHAAVTETRIEAVLMVNLPLFLWTTGDSIAESKKRTYAFSHYKARLMEPAHWRRLLRGESDIAGIIKGQISRFAKRMRLPGQGASKAAGEQDPAAFARNLMAKLSRRGMRSLFLFDPDHAGAYEIQNLFGKGGAGLKSFAGTEIKITPGLGEAVGESAARKIAADIMIDFVTAS